MAHLGVVGRVGRWTSSRRAGLATRLPPMCFRHASPFPSPPTPEEGGHPSMEYWRGEYDVCLAAKWSSRPHHLARDAMFLDVELGTGERRGADIRIVSM